MVGELLKSKQQTISVAESCTGGGLGAMLTEVAGSSAYFYGGIIAYANQIKIQQLGVLESYLEEFGAVSPQVAQQMALGVKTNLKTSCGISITGIAGPDGGTETKPVGLVYVGIANPDNQVETYEFTFGKNRDRDLVRYLSACYALDNLRRKLLS